MKRPEATVVDGTGQDDGGKRARANADGPGMDTGVQRAPVNLYATAYTHATQRTAQLPAAERTGLGAILAAAVRQCR